jgi:hypothetical protein
MATRQARSASWEEAVDAATDDAVARWRMIVLLRAGYQWDDAFELALDPHVDLHVAAELASKGCASDVARRILL